MTSNVSYFTLLSLFTFLLVGCKADPLPRKPIPVPPSPQALQRGGKAPAAARPAPVRPAAVSAQGTSRVAGLTWNIPKRWKLGPRRPMRVATYFIPGANSYKATRGECSIFYFGQRQGGSILANISRWKGQFQPAQGQSKLTLEKIKETQRNGIKVATIELKGTFLFSPRPMSPTKIPRPNHYMLGAIARAPKGLVFFKCVGPSSVMTAAQPEFNRMLGSFRTR